MKSISSSSRSMSVSRSFSNYAMRSSSRNGWNPKDHANVGSISSSGSRSLSRPRRRPSDSRGSSSRSYSPPRRRQVRDSTESMSMSSSRSRRRRELSSRSTSSRSYISSSSSSHHRKSRSPSRTRRTNRHRRYSKSSDRSSSSRRRRRSRSPRRHASSPKRRERERHADERRSKKAVVKGTQKSDRSRREEYSSTKHGIRIPLRGSNRSAVRPRRSDLLKASGYRAGSSRRRPLDRTVHTPFLLRIYAFVDETMDANYTPEEYEDFRRKIELSDSVKKLELYIWADSTLRDLVGLVKDLCDTARHKDGIWRFHFNNKTRDVLGHIHSYKWRYSSDSVTLKNTSFRIGDSLLLFFHGDQVAPGVDIEMAL